jgi:hypothetical protein
MHTFVNTPAIRCGLMHLLEAWLRELQHLNHSSRISSRSISFSIMGSSDRKDHDVVLVGCGGVAGRGDDITHSTF